MYKVYFSLSAVFFGLVFYSCGEVSNPSGTDRLAETEAENPQPFVSIQEEDPSVLVAEWDGGKLTLTQIDRFVDPDVVSANPMVNPASDMESIIAQQRKTITETLVGNYLLLQEARTMNIQLTDSEKEAVLHRAKGNFESEVVYTNYLKNAKQTEEDFVNVLVNIELGKKSVEQKEEEIWNRMDDEKLRSYYDAHIDKFTPPHRSFFNRVDIHIKEDRTEEEAKNLAERLRAEVAEKIRSMTALEEKRNVMREYARERSDGFEASYNGGYVTMYHTEKFAKGFSPQCMQTAKETGVGELSPVYRSQHGYGFLLVHEQHPSYVHPFESDMIQKMLPNLILEEEMLRWRDEMKEKYRLKIYEKHFEDEFTRSLTVSANTAASP